MKSNQQAMQFLCGPVIPAVHTIEAFQAALQAKSPTIMALFGNINNIPELLQQAYRHQKRLLLHMDLLEGIGKDRYGVEFLAEHGAQAIITTKPHLGKLAREQGLFVVQRLFVMDSAALRSGENLLKNFRPDVLEILPSSVPASVMREILDSTGLPVVAGGLVLTADDVKQALSKGASAVSTSKQELWDLSFPKY